MDSKAIAQAIEWIVTHPVAAEKMEQKGRRAIVDKYNWEHKGKKRCQFHETILQN